MNKPLDLIHQIDASSPMSYKKREKIKPRRERRKEVRDRIPDRGDAGVEQRLTNLERRQKDDTGINGFLRKSSNPKGDSKNAVRSGVERP